jgi:hypothetical protein
MASAAATPAISEMRRADPRWDGGARRGEWGGREWVLLFRDLVHDLLRECCEVLQWGGKAPPQRGIQPVVCRQ